MSVKYFCDVCGKENTLNLLSKWQLISFSNDGYGPYEAEVCKKCKDIVLKPLKCFRTSCCVSVEIPTEKGKKKKK